MVIFIVETTRITTIYRTITAIPEQIHVRQEAVRIEPSSNLRIIIPALAVVEACFGVIQIPAVADRVEFQYVAVNPAIARIQQLGVQQLAPGIIGMPADERPASVIQPDHVTLQVPLVPVRLRAVAADRQLKPDGVAALVGTPAYTMNG